MKHTELDATEENPIPAQSVDPLTKIYVEPTNRCNLSCVTCIRHSWDEPFEDMAWPVYQALMEGLANFSDAKTIAFAGFGEPLLHPRFPEMVRLAHENGLRTEMTSNAMLLTSPLAERLIDAGLDQFTVSIDGTSDESHGAVRPGASLKEIINSVRTLYWWSATKCSTQLDIETSLHEDFLRKIKDTGGSELGFLGTADFQFPIKDGLDLMPSAPLKIGIEFVAMKSNIHELPALQKIAENIRASFILVSNVLPYTAELQNEILYSLEPTSHEGQGSDRNPNWILPKMDWSLDTLKSISTISSQQANLSYLDIDLNQRNNYCPFIRPGSLALSCHGTVSPCPPLMHSYSCYIRDRKKFFRRCEYGNLMEQSLESIWLQPDYAGFRERVRKFEFSPCTDCSGCEFADGNEIDCQGNPFPVCGDCLWARGILRCA
ncbi:MAG: radical SAM protein [Acidobacteria bacterium]|nr:radical SAM protein [Acidobacteriota bacterium]